MIKVSRLVIPLLFLPGSHHIDSSPSSNFAFSIHHCRPLSREIYLESPRPGAQTPPTVAGGAPATQIFQNAYRFVVGLDGFPWNQLIHTPPEPLFIALYRIESLEHSKFDLSLFYSHKSVTAPFKLPIRYAAHVYFKVLYS